MARWGTHLVRVWALTSSAFGPLRHSPGAAPLGQRADCGGKASRRMAVDVPLSRRAAASGAAGAMGRCDAPVRCAGPAAGAVVEAATSLATGGEFPCPATSGVDYVKMFRGGSQPHFRRRCHVPPAQASGRPLGLRRWDRSRRVRRESRGAVVGGGLKRRAPLRHAPQRRALRRSRPLRPPRPRRRPR